MAVRVPRPTRLPAHHRSHRRRRAHPDDPDPRAWRCAAGLEPHAEGPADRRGNLPLFRHCRHRRRPRDRFRCGPCGRYIPLPATTVAQTRSAASDAAGTGLRELVVTPATSARRDVGTWRRERRRMRYRLADGVDITSASKTDKSLSPPRVTLGTDAAKEVQTPSTRTAAHNASTAAMREVGTVNNPRRVYSPTLADTSYRRKTLRPTRFDSDPT